MTYVSLSPPAERRNRGLAASLVVFSALLVVQATWLLLAGLFDPGIAGLPTEAQAAAATASYRGESRIAARLAAIRGSLWAQCAFTYGTLLWADASVEDAGDARTCAEKALIYAPHRSDMWLVVASLGSRYGWPMPKPAEALKLSYYTGPNETALVPLRLAIAAGSTMLQDADLQLLVRRDIDTILSGRPELRSALAAAYREASPGARQFFENTVAHTNSRFLPCLRGQSASC